MKCFYGANRPDTEVCNRAVEFAMHWAIYWGQELYFGRAQFCHKHNTIKSAEILENKNVFSFSTAKIHS